MQKRTFCLQSGVLAWLALGTFVACGGLLGVEAPTYVDTDASIPQPGEPVGPDVVGGMPSDAEDASAPTVDARTASDALLDGDVGPDTSRLNLIGNGGFETEEGFSQSAGKWFFFNYSADAAPSTSTASFSLGHARSGLRSAKVFFDGVGSFASLQQYPSPAMAASQKYRVSFWLKGLAGGESYLVRIQQCCVPYRAHAEDVGVAPAVFARRSYVVTIPSDAASSIAIVMQNHTPNSTIVFDDVEVSPEP